MGGSVGAAEVGEVGAVVIALAEDEVEDEGHSPDCEDKGEHADLGGWWRGYGLAAWACWYGIQR